MRSGKESGMTMDWFSWILVSRPEKEKPGYFEILIYYVIASFVREAWKVTGFRT